MNKRTPVVVALVLVAAAGIAAAGVATIRPPETTTVEPHELRSRIVARASVVPTDGTAEVRARTSGRAVSVLARAGDAVTEGQLLATLEARNLELALAEARAELAALGAQARSIEEGARPEERDAIAAETSAAKAELALAIEREAREKNLRSAEISTDRGVSEVHHAADAARAKLAAAEARRRLANAGGRTSDVEAARARIAQARARVEGLETELSWTRLVAPRAGVVLARRLSPGDQVFPGGPPVFELADPSRVEVKVEVEERDAREVALGNDVTFVHRGGGASLGAGKIVRLGARLERRTIGAEESRVRADSHVRTAYVAWNGAPLPLGTRLEAEVQGPTRTVATSLPRAAVRYRDGHALVRRPCGPWFVETQVELGDADATRVEVRGLTRGEVVLVGP